MGQRVHKLRDLAGHKARAGGSRAGAVRRNLHAGLPRRDFGFDGRCEKDVSVLGGGARTHRDGHGEGQRFRQLKAQHDARGLRGNARLAHERAQMVQMGPTCICQQILFPGQVDELVLDADRIGQRLQKQPHRIARLQREAGQTFIDREHGGFHRGGVRLGKAHVGQDGQIDAT